MTQTLWAESLSGARIYWIYVEILSRGRGDAQEAVSVKINRKKSEGK